MDVSTVRTKRNHASLSGQVGRRAESGGRPGRGAPQSQLFARVGVLTFWFAFCACFLLGTEVRRAGVTLPERCKATLREFLALAWGDAFDAAAALPGIDADAQPPRLELQFALRCQN